MPRAGATTTVPGRRASNGKGRFAHITVNRDRPIGADGGGPHPTAAAGRGGPEAGVTVPHGATGASGPGNPALPQGKERIEDGSSSEGDDSAQDFDIDVDAAVEAEHRD